MANNDKKNYYDNDQIKINENLSFIDCFVCDWDRCLHISKAEHNLNFMSCIEWNEPRYTNMVYTHIRFHAIFAIRTQMYTNHSLYEIVAEIESGSVAENIGQKWKKEL